MKITDKVIKLDELIDKVSIHKGDALIGVKRTGESATTQHALNETLKSGSDNYLLNGDMQLARTAASTALPTTPAISTVDAWAVFQNSASAGTSAQSTTVPSGFRNSLRIGRTAASSSTNEIGTQQALKTADSISLAGRSVKLSVYFDAGADFSGSNVNVALFTGTGTDQDVSIMSTWTGVATPIGTTQVITTTATKYEFLGTIGASATQVGCRFFYTPSGTAGADDNLYITGVRLEIVDVVSSFERRHFWQELALLRPMLPACGRLSNLGGSDPFSQCHLVPFNGNTILINGVAQIIPAGSLSSSGGVQATYSSCSIDKVLAQALAANTKYYVYVYMLNGVMTLDFSTTTWADDSFFGNRVKSGDTTCSLVGFLRTNNASKTLGNAKAQTITSHFNRLRYTIFTNLDGTTTNNTATELNSSNRIEFVQWSDDLPIVSAVINAGNSTSGNRVNFGIGLNSTTVVTGVTSVAQVPSITLPSVNLKCQTLNPGEDQYFLCSLLGYETEDVGAGTLTLSSGMMFADNLAV